MKSNIDLTANGDFRKKEPLNLWDLFYKPKFLWNFEGLALELKDKSQEVFITGNKQEVLRELRFRRRNSEINEVCHRCGKPLSPWNKHFNLCKECEIHISKTSNKTESKCIRCGKTLYPWQSKITTKCNKCKKTERDSLNLDSISLEVINELELEEKQNIIF